MRLGLEPQPAQHRGGRVRDHGTDDGHGGRHGGGKILPHATHCARNRGAATFTRASFWCHFSGTAKIEEHPAPTDPVPNRKAARSLPVPAR
ncbi:hypothetical protein GCM10017567_46100 [Amycolatopsis bullii]|uniref:Uncharacterized protein n=1 Tax=Amycolatopsis bullii TaxID=941987 RepID=A0ABQ3KIS6_9PSEU|nr:hypothetical protein GCM10017567_46100 [Amycolatopsis bullii]